MFNLAIDSKLRGCDVVALKVEDIAPHGCAIDRATVRQRKRQVPVKFELTDQTREAVDHYLRAAGKKPGDFLFTGRGGGIGQCMTTRQYARLVSGWVASIGLDSKLFGTHSLRRTKAAAELAFDAFIESYTPKYEKAADCLSRDRDALLAFYDFPAEHWKHLRTTNPIESTVRHRTIRSKGCLSNRTALAMVFKLLEGAQKS